MFLKIPKWVLGKNQLHFGVESRSLTIKIDFFVVLSNLQDPLKQNGLLNTTLQSLLATMKQWWRFVNMGFQ
jgi:hypothetical protein